MPTVDITATVKGGATTEHRYGFPGSWAELTPTQLGRLAVQLALPVEQEVKRANIFKMLAAIPEYPGSYITAEDLLFYAPQTDPDGRDAGMAWQFLPQLDWAFGEPCFEKSLLHTINHNKQVWIGPQDQLKNFSVKRWGFVNICLDIYAANPTEEALNNVLGALYVPTGERWTNEGIEQRGRLLAKLTPAIKSAAVFNYRAVHAELPLLFPKTFEKKTEAVNDFGFQGLVVSIAGPKFGAPKKAAKANLHDVLIHCEQVLQEDERTKRNAPSADGFKPIGEFVKSGPTE